MANKRLLAAALSGIWTLLPALPGHAEDTPPAKPTIVVGASSEAILAQQREGKTAGAAQPMTGEVAARSYQRYLESYNKPMPDFKEAAGGSTSSSGGKSN
jgi:hypothetical protein